MEQADKTIPSAHACWIGIDLGGTKILTGLFDSDFRCLTRVKVSTKAAQGWREVVDRITRSVAEALEESGIRMSEIGGIGIGSPGSVIPDQGTIRFSGNLGWENVPLQEELERQLEKPVAVENDCNVATLGIHRIELRGQPASMIGVFLGTGIGGGLIINHRLYSGSSHTAGELGHMVIDIEGPECTCGNRGCFEAFASRRALFREIVTSIDHGEKTVLSDLLGNNLTKMRSRDLRKALKKGDPLVDRVVRAGAQYTGIAIGNLLNLLNPAYVVLGGGLIEALEETMMPTLRETAREHAFPGASDGVTIQASKLADDAGIYGAGVLAREKWSPTQSTASTSPSTESIPTP